MDSSMYLNLYIGLLTATAIVATLLTYKPSTNKQAINVKPIIFAYGLSAFFTLVGIMELMLGVSSILIVGTYTLDFLIATVSLTFFVLGTLELMRTAYLSKL
jgi:hypothetical protein